MKTGIRALKKQAKRVYHDQLGDLMVIHLLYSVCLNVITIISVTMGTYIIRGPLEYGLYKSYYRASRDEDVTAAYLLDGFKNCFGDSFLIGLVQTLVEAVPRGLLLAHIMILVVSLTTLSSKLEWINIEMSSSTLVISLFIGLLLIAADALSIVLRYALAMSQYILARNPDMDPADALKASGRMMKGNKFRLFRLKLSYILWAVAALCTGGLSTIYARPYLTSAKVQMFNDIYAMC